jgi:hypothetical protein
MSIRLLARELYQVTRLVEKLELTLRDPTVKDAEKRRVEEELRGARAERDRLRAMLDGAKDG